MNVELEKYDITTEFNDMIRAMAYTNALFARRVDNVM